MHRLNGRASLPNHPGRVVAGLCTATATGTTKRFRRGFIPHLLSTQRQNNIIHTRSHPKASMSECIATCRAGILQPGAWYVTVADHACQRMATLGPLAYEASAPLSKPGCLDLLGVNSLFNIL